MAFLLKQLKWLYNEFGFSSVYNAGRDAILIILTRSLRMLAYGTNSLVLALFFSSLKFTDFQIGLFMTLTLLGDVLLSVLLTLVADNFGRRKILFAGSFLMVLSGTTFAVFENFWILLFAAVVGVISATGGDFGPFRAIEESTLSHLTTPKTRADVLAWYVTTSALGSSIGSEVSGRMVHGLQARDGWTLKDAYHALFWMYSGMGVLNAGLVCLLSSNCEVQVLPQTEESEFMLAEDGEGSDEDGDEEHGEQRQSSTPLPAKAPPTSKLRRVFGWFGDRFAQISKETRAIMYKLWFLLTVDCLADGMVPLSLTNYYMDTKFEISKAALGDITSVSYFLAAISTVFAGPLSRRLGLINTMVFTHIPSSTAVLLFPFPRGIVMTVALLLLRMGLNNMDQAPRAAFIAAVVKPEERTAVMGITTMLRTLAATCGPTITGILAGNDRFWVAYVAAGALRLAYDFGLWAMFVNMKLYQHEVDDSDKPAPDRRRQSDEEEMAEMTEIQKP
jgi:MFS family permease